MSTPGARPGLGLMVCGTASDVGKSHVVTGLCRIMRRRGVKVAPFKAQNMALNSYVTPSGHEIGRAQAVQAFASGAEPEVSMNPILLKPTGERTCQVVLNGEPVGHVSAAEYHAMKPGLLDSVMSSLEDLRSRFEVVLLEGAGSPAEINLLEHDIVNLRVAALAGLPALLVGDIDRGGVFAALYGTVTLLPDEYRRLVRGFVVNKLRGDPSLMGEGLRDLERRCGVPTIGVLPFVEEVALDAEDSLALSGPRPRTRTSAATGCHADDAEALDVAAIRFPRISNFTDLDALEVEPGVGVRFVEDTAALGDPDLVILPGTKATVSDLRWLKGRGLARAIEQRMRQGTEVLAICGGYQMAGRLVRDHVESGAGTVPGLGWLDVETEFLPTKLTRQRRGSALGARVQGYEIHHGLVTQGAGAGSWVTLDDAYGFEREGATSPEPGRVRGTNLHGIFEEDGFRSAFLSGLSERRAKRYVPSGVSFAAERERQIDRLADLIECHLDIEALDDIIESGVTA